MPDGCLLVTVVLLDGAGAVEFAAGVGGIQDGACTSGIRCIGGFCVEVEALARNVER